MLDTSEPDRLETLLREWQRWLLTLPSPGGARGGSELGDVAKRAGGAAAAVLPLPFAFAAPSFFVLRKRPPEPLARRMAWRWRDS